MYNTFISDDDSRVKVAGFDTDYINANYIDVCNIFFESLGFYIGVVVFKPRFTHKYYSRHFVITWMIFYRATRKETHLLHHLVCKYFFACTK